LPKSWRQLASQLISCLLSEPSACYQFSGRLNRRAYLLTGFCKLDHHKVADRKGAVTGMKSHSSMMPRHLSLLGTS
jgi:hypothetical protein